MERIRECVETARCKWRDFVKRNWHNQPEGDAFRLFDVVLLVGAIRPRELPRKWQRNSWKMYRGMTVFHFFILLLNLIEHVVDNSAYGETVWHACMFVAACMISLQHITLNRYFESLQTARDFINSKPVDSGDIPYDTTVRKRCFQRAQFMAGSLLLMACLDELLIFIPNAGIEALLTTPRMIRSLEPWIANGAQFLFVAFLMPLWVCKRFAATGLVCSLLYGFQMEFDIFAHGFDDVWNRVQLEVEEGMPPTSTATEYQPDMERLRLEQREKLFWKHLNQHVINHAKKHIELLDKLQSLESAIRWLFFAVYYYTLLVVSPVIYIVLLEGISGLTTMIALFVGCLFLECYLWCSQIEAFHDINNELETSIMDLMRKIPYSGEHHADYTGMRKTLLIMKMNVRNSCQFSCGGVFDISVAVVTELLDISYSVFTFLRDFGKVH